MVTIKIHFEDLEEAISQLSIEEKHRLKAQLDQQLFEVASGERIPGLHKGMIWMSDDFNDPLPDEFWLGEDA